MAIKHGLLDNVPFMSMMFPFEPPFSSGISQPSTWWLIPVSKWMITTVISELTLLSPVITRGTTYLLSGVNHHPCLIANPHDGISILSLMDVKWLSQQQTTLW